MACVARWVARAVFLIALLTSTEAAAAWQGFSTGRFAFVGEERAQVLEGRARALQRFDALLRTLHPPVPGRAFVPVTVVFARQPPSGMPRGFYLEDAAGPLAFVATDPGPTWPAASLQTVLFHEYAHHYLRQAFPAAYPPWFVEGFAELYATTTFDTRGGATIGRPPAYRAQALFGGRRMPVAGLLAEVRVEAERPIAGFYEQAWLLMHYLVFEPGQRARLNAYLLAAARGRRDAPALLGSPGELDRTLSAYLGKGRMAVRRVPVTVTAESLVATVLSAAQGKQLEQRLTNAARH